MAAWRVTLLTFDFMLNAFGAGTVVAVVAGVVGYMLVLRSQAFAGHALAHMGFTGATGAALLGVSPFLGTLAATVAGGIGIGLLGQRETGRDVAVGMVLSLSLGLGLLFLHYTAQASGAAGLLFGNILGVDADTLWAMLALGILSLGALAIIARPLLFASLQPELAEAQGVPMQLVSVLFLVIAAVAVALAVQVVGVLLVFALLVGPAAAAQLWTGRPGRGMALSAGLALAQTWAALALSWVTDWPVSVWITASGAAAYLLAVLARR